MTIQPRAEPLVQTWLSPTALQTFTAAFADAKPRWNGTPLVGDTVAV
jgi:hypothetical protein